jgi:UDP-GlcNAc:undecaprenyl-phosphate GlcNAc-1-phosphate transferase
MEIKYLLIAILSFSIAFLLIPVLRKIALRIQLVDKPNSRKVHHSAIPLVGGISIFLATILTVFLLINSEIKILEYTSIFASTLIILIMGVIDDKYDIKAILKLTIQLLLAHFIFESGIKIESLHGLFGIYELSEWMQYVLTVTTITGVVNAFNLMDGIDGLAAGLSIVAFLLFASFSYIVGDYFLTTIFIALFGSTCAFLRYNFSSKSKIFMGDAGSLTIGFVLVVAGIKILQTSQDQIHASLFLFGVIGVFILPVFDALRVFRKRIKAGKSPLSADRSHLHHLLLKLGFRHKIATFTIILLLGFHLLAGYFFFHFAGITFSVISILIMFNAITSFLVYNAKIISWRQKIRLMELGM